MPSIRPRPLARLLAAALVAAHASDTAAAQGTGTVVGRVRLVAPAPANPVVRMGVDPACSRAYGDTRPTHDFVVRDADGGLANVFVEVRGAFERGPAPAAAVVLDQKGCMFRPRVLAMRRGQTLEVRNADPTLHNVHALSAKGNAFNVSQVAGRPPFMVAMAHAETMVRITCDVHRWMPRRPLRRQARSGSGGAEGAPRSDPTPLAASRSGPRALRATRESTWQAARHPRR